MGNLKKEAKRETYACKFGLRQGSDLGFGCRSTEDKIEISYRLGDLGIWRRD